MEGEKKKRVRIEDFQRKKEVGEKIICTTAYDYSFGRILDMCNIDLILVGDSLGNVCGGEETTLSVTLDQMIQHTKYVRKGVKRSLLVMDMPFLSYELGEEQGMMNVGRVVKETGVDGVKLECKDERILSTIEKIVGMGIPVMGHIGLMPQAVGRLGGYKVQGRLDRERRQLKALAKKCEDSGVFGVVLEMISKEISGEITEHLTIPTIGIGSGRNCDGQIVVSYDILGLNKSFNPKFLRRYSHLEDIIKDSINLFAQDIQSGNYPNDKESY